jgi:hypothetical protein
MTILDPRLGVFEGPGQGKTTTSSHYKYLMAVPQFLGGWPGRTTAPDAPGWGQDKGSRKRY